MVSDNSVEPNIMIFAISSQNLTKNSKTFPYILVDRHTCVCVCACVEKMAVYWPCYDWICTAVTIQSVLAIMSHGAETDSWLKLKLHGVAILALFNLDSYDIHDITIHARIRLSALKKSLTKYAIRNHLVYMALRQLAILACCRLGNIMHHGKHTGWSVMGKPLSFSVTRIWSNCQKTIVTASYNLLINRWTWRFPCVTS